MVHLHASWGWTTSLSFDQKVGWRDIWTKLFRRAHWKHFGGRLDRTRGGGFQKDPKSRFPSFGGICGQRSQQRPKIHLQSQPCHHQGWNAPWSCKPGTRPARCKMRNSCQQNDEEVCLHQTSIKEVSRHHPRHHSFLGTILVPNQVSPKMHRWSKESVQDGAMV